MTIRGGGSLRMLCLSKPLTDIYLSSVNTRVISACPLSALTRTKPASVLLSVVKATQAYGLASFCILMKIYLQSFSPHIMSIKQMICVIHYLLCALFCGGLIVCLFRIPFGREGGGVNMLG